MNTAYKTPKVSDYVSISKPGLNQTCGCIGLVKLYIYIYIYIHLYPPSDNKQQAA